MDMLNKGHSACSNYQLYRPPFNDFVGTEPVALDTVRIAVAISLRIFMINFDGSNFLQVCRTDSVAHLRQITLIGLFRP